MDAVEFLKEKARMCESYNHLVNCGRCPLNEMDCDVPNPSEDGFFEQVAIVEQWSKDHPRQTRADKFKEVFGKDVMKIFRHETMDVCIPASWLNAPYEAPKEEE